MIILLHSGLIRIASSETIVLGSDWKYSDDSLTQKHFSIFMELYPSGLKQTLSTGLNKAQRDQFLSVFGVMLTKTPAICDVPELEVALQIWKTEAEIMNAISNH